MIKHISVAILALFFSSFANSAPVYYGNTTQLDLTGTYGANFLLGQTISVSQSVELIAAGMILPAGASLMNVGIYSDNGGNPDQLIATTGSFSVAGAGSFETLFTTTPTVDPGKYWFMTLFESNTPNYYTITGTARTVKYMSLAYTGSLPSTFGSPLEFCCQDYNTFLRTETLSAVPIPAAAWLFSTALIGLIGFSKRRKAT